MSSARNDYRTLRTIFCHRTILIADFISRKKLHDSQTERNVLKTLETFLRGLALARRTEPRAPFHQLRHFRFAIQAHVWKCTSWLRLCETSVVLNMCFSMASKFNLLHHILVKGGMKIMKFQQD